jgi:hypothetical protein
MTFHFQDNQQLQQLIPQWFKNGQKEWEGTYKDGKPDGKNTGWYENGQKEREWNFKDGEKDGLWSVRKNPPWRLHHHG